MLELPEVLTLSRQLDKELRGRTIASAGRGNSPHKKTFPGGATYYCPRCQK